MDVNEEGAVVDVAPHADQEDNEVHFTEIPSKFMLHDGKVSSVNGSACENHSRMHEAMWNKKYEKAIAANTAGRQATRYVVPVNQPLPLPSLDATKGRREGDANKESILAPLFRNSAGGTAGLSFLTPAENNPRREIEQRKKQQKEEERPRDDPGAKQRMNEPKHMPDLSKKVPKDFIPQCATVSTKALPSYVDKSNTVPKAADKAELHSKKG